MYIDTCLCVYMSVFVHVSHVYVCVCPHVHVYMYMFVYINIFRFGQQERVFRMEYISNSPFADNEFVKWKEEVYQLCLYVYVSVVMLLQ